MIREAMKEDRDGSARLFEAVAEAVIVETTAR
jgi:hypothetical protein